MRLGSPQSRAELLKLQPLSLPSPSLSLPLSLSLSLSLASSRVAAAEQPLLLLIITVESRQKLRAGSAAEIHSPGGKSARTSAIYCRERGSAPSSHLCEMFMKDMEFYAGDSFAKTRKESSSCMYEHARRSLNSANSVSFRLCKTDIERVEQPFVVCRIQAVSRERKCIFSCRRYLSFSRHGFAPREGDSLNSFAAVFRGSIGSLLR